MINIAMIEDDTELAEVLTQYLSTFNIKVTNYEDPYIGLSAIALNTFDLIILDLTLPGLDGLEVCQELLKKYDIPIIISRNAVPHIDYARDLQHPGKLSYQKLAKTMVDICT